RQSTADTRSLGQKLHHHKGAAEFEHCEKEHEHQGRHEGKFHDGCGGSLRLTCRCGERTRGVSSYHWLQVHGGISSAVPTGRGRSRRSLQRFGLWCRTFGGNPITNRKS